MSSSLPEFVVVGHINKAHGTRGELFVWPLTDRPDSVFSTGARLHLGDREGRPVRIPETVLEVSSVRPFQQGFLVRFNGVIDRTAAEGIKDQYLLTPFDPPTDRETDEFYYHELLGLDVEAKDGTALGRVREVYELSPDHMLDVEGVAGSILIPLNARLVVSVDIESNRLVIDPPEGFLELQE